jgi:aerobic-type carbon monoxide dehydrogenase small subunit (CoxS/CutS family)
MAVHKLKVNGVEHKVEAEPERTLLEVLREDLGLTGSKYGCGEGQCGACTVLIDGRAERSCIATVAGTAGKQITTIEGLEKNGRLHAVQEAFLNHDAMQCGYCIPGMVMSAVGLLRKTPNPTAAQVRQSMQGNICRCGAYPRIVDAVLEAAKKSNGSNGGAK